MDKVIDFINKTTNEEKLFLIQNLSRSICIAHYHTDKDSVEIMDLCDIDPIVMNGTSFQLNTTEFGDHLSEKYCDDCLKDNKDKEVIHG